MIWVGAAPVVVKNVGAFLIHDYIFINKSQRYKKRQTSKIKKNEGKNDSTEINDRSIQSNGFISLCKKRDKS